MQVFLEQKIKLKIPTIQWGNSGYFCSYQHKNMQIKQEYVAGKLFLSLP